MSMIKEREYIHMRERERRRKKGRDGERKRKGKREERRGRKGEHQLVPATGGIERFCPRGLGSGVTKTRTTCLKPGSGERKSKLVSQRRYLPSISATRTTLQFKNWLGKIPENKQTKKFFKNTP